MAKAGCVLDVLHDPQSLFFVLKRVSVPLGTTVCSPVTGNPRINQKYQDCRFAFPNGLEAF